MKIAFLWFSWREDEELLYQSIRSVWNLAMEPGDTLWVAEQDTKPISVPYRIRISGEFPGIQFFTRAGCESNLNGAASVPLMALDCMIRASEGMDGVGKIDCDTLLFGRDWRREWEASGAQQYGMAQRHHPDRLIGSAYFLRADCLAAVREQVAERVEEFAPLYAEDQAITKCCHDLFPDERHHPFDIERGFFSTWNYRRPLHPKAIYRRYQMVTFGDRHLICRACVDKKACVARAQRRCLDAALRDRDFVLANLAKIPQK